MFQPIVNNNGAPVPGLIKYDTTDRAREVHHQNKIALSLYGESSSPKTVGDLSKQAHPAISPYQYDLRTHAGSQHPIICSAPGESSMLGSAHYNDPTYELMNHH